MHINEFLSNQTTPQHVVHISAARCPHPVGPRRVIAVSAARWRWRNTASGVLSQYIITRTASLIIIMCTNCFFLKIIMLITVH